MKKPDYVTIKYRVLCIAVRPMQGDEKDVTETAALLINDAAKKNYVRDEVRAGNFRIETTEVTTEQ